jgi:electron transport complex protein RnfD
MAEDKEERTEKTEITQAPAESQAGAAPSSGAAADKDASGVRPLVVSPPPHLKAPDTTSKIMLTVVAALAPIMVYDIYLFKGAAISTFFWSIFGALLAEAGIQRLRRQRITLYDGSALLTGILFAMVLPPKVPFWLSFIGGFVAIALGKQIYGGLGHNIFNPALVGRVFVLISWAKHLTSDWYEKVSIDTISGATPLFVAKQLYQGTISADLTKFYSTALFRNPYGSMGEVSALLIILGLVILLAFRVIDWRTPAAYIGSVFVLTWWAGRDAIFYTLSGGVLFGAVFMATDYVTSPITKKGKVIFGLGCGFLTFLMRLYASTPEAVAYAILFMNALTPLIDTYTRPRVFGAVKNA